MKRTAQIAGANFLPLPTEEGTPAPGVFPLVRALRPLAAFTLRLLAALTLRLLAALLPGPAQAGGAACSGVIASPTDVAGKTAYDPYSPVSVSDTYEVTVTNTGAQPCAFALSLQGQGDRPVLGGRPVLKSNSVDGRLAYAILAANGREIDFSQPAAKPVPHLVSASVAPNTSARIPFVVAIERGQAAAPGAFSDTLDLALYACANGAVTGARLDAGALTIRYAVPQSMSVNLKGGDPRTTLSFEPFTEGAQRQTLIEARSNMGYRFKVSSENNGAMALTPAVPGQSWTAPYRASFAGKELDLRQPAAVVGLPATHPRADATYALTVTIGDVSKKRAGKYRDTITIEIDAARP